jgi:hypothetical protein
MEHSRVEWLNGAESEGGQNLVDQNNFVYRKARFSPDKAKQFFKWFCYITVDPSTPAL